MKTLRRAILAAVGVCALAGCASSTDSSDSWSRSYLAPIDRVFGAVTDVLEDDGYLVEVDRSKDRITADPPRNSRGLSPSLAVKVVEKSGRVLVDVQTRAGSNDSVTRGSQVNTSIVEFFHELELRLQGLKD
jgi:hypothetical protein